MPQPLVLDHDRLDAMRREYEHDARLVDEILAIFLAEAPPILRELAAHAESGRLHEAGRLAHRLAGSSRTIGAMVFGDACASVEESALADESLADALAVIPLLDGMLADACAAIRRYLERPLPRAT